MASLIPYSSWPDNNRRALNHWQLQKIKSALGISVSNDALLRTALTHSSYLNEPEGADAESNDRLETLGDAVIQLAITQTICEMDAALDDGHITLIRSRVVRNETLARVAGKLGIGEYLRMGKGERQSGGANKASNLAGAFEAIVGAIYSGSNAFKRGSTDRSGLPPAIPPDISRHHAAAAQFCIRALQEEIDAAYAAVTAAPPAPNTAGKHPKSALQEITQAKYGSLPEYHVIQSTGKDNDRTFVVEVSFNGKTLGKGSGRSKQAAETAAAKQALRAGAF